MARGTKNYFRHSSNAFEDEKIQKTISLLGFEGYAFFFILLELCAKQCENEFKDPIVFHKQTIKTILRKQEQSCNKVLTKLQQSGLFVVTFSESFYEFSIPNLSKYMGRYESKNALNTPNKRKEKKSKYIHIPQAEFGGDFDEEKSDQSNKDSTNNVYTEPSPGELGKITFNELLEIWNHAASQINIKSCTPGTKMAQAIEKRALEAFKDYKSVEDWERIVEAVAYNPFLSGANERHWRASLEWLFQVSPSKRIKNYILLMAEWDERNKRQKQEF